MAEEPPVAEELARPPVAEELALASVSRPDPTAHLDGVIRECAPGVVAALVRRYGDFDAAEDALQEALLAASRQWPADGVPDNPQAWLIRVASRRLIDAWRSESARTAREERVAEEEPVEVSSYDDSLALFLLCCHPVLPAPSQVALTLRAVGGLSTAQIARALLVPEATMAQRISRAKARLRETGARFTVPPVEELPARVAATAQALYLVFTEGHTSTTGAGLYDVVLADEAIRLTRRLHALVSSPVAEEGAPPVAEEVALATVSRPPRLVERSRSDRRDHPEIAGLLALMLLTDARREARTAEDGSLIPLADQDRMRWDEVKIAEGISLISRALPQGPVGPFQLQAAIAAVHAEAALAEETDWAQIDVLYRMLHELAPSPVVTLNRAVAVAMVHGPAAGLALVDPLLDEPSLRRGHRLHAVRAHLLERDGRPAEAREAYRLAASLATSVPEQRYLNARLSADRD